MDSLVQLGLFSGPMAFLKEALTALALGGRPCFALDVLGFRETAPRPKSVEDEDSA